MTSEWAMHQRACAEMAPYEHCIPLIWREITTRLKFTMHNADTASRTTLIWRNTMSSRLVKQARLCWALALASALMAVELGCRRNESKIQSLENLAAADNVAKHECRGKTIDANDIPAYLPTGVVLDKGVDPA